MKNRLFFLAVAPLLMCGMICGPSVGLQDSVTAPKQEPAVATQQPGAQQTADGPTEEQIANLAKYLTGARLTGHFTVTGNEDAAPRSESYWIDKAEKHPEGDKWTITARIKYGNNDITVPMGMDIQWAGGTPVITVDQLTIIGMGTFDARVLFRGGLYAGTWRHDEVGGHLYGTVTTQEEQTKEADGKPDGGQPVSAPVLPCKETGPAGGK